MLEQTRNVLERRADLWNDLLGESGLEERVTEVTVTPDGFVELGVSGPAARDLDLTPLLGNTEVSLQLLDDRDQLIGSPLLTNADFADAFAVMVPGPVEYPAINFKLTKEAAELFEEATSRAVGQRLAILIDGEVIQAPVIRDAIGRYGQLSLAEEHTWGDAELLALILKAGLLPAPVQVVRRRDTI